MAKKQVNPVTPSDADAFAMLVLKWQRELNLMDWRIVQSHRRSKGSCAEVVRMDLPARLATYRIGETFGAEPVTEIDGRKDRRTRATPHLSIRVQGSRPRSRINRRRDRGS